MRRRPGRVRRGARARLYIASRNPPLLSLPFLFRFPALSRITRPGTLQARLSPALLSGKLPPDLIRSAARPGIEGVAEPVPDQVERERGEEQEQAREQHHPPGHGEDLAGVRELLAPRGSR